MIPPHMDMDVLSTEAKSLFKNNKLNKIPPVARAVSEILNFYNVDMANKNILVVGTGKLVGEPVSSMLNLRNLVYKTIDKNTDENSKEELLKNADIIISGAGSPHFIKKEMIKPGVVLIDAGTSEQSGKLVGDIDPGCAEVASLMTSVPNGVGPVTMACLFLNI
jgi:methylenetetrahydrofolate dehydrogenase (NADP+)/methenyltetrahydrofolate cyclohydrolase